MGASEHDDDAGFSEQTIRFLDILARALHVKDAELEATLDAIVATTAATLDSARYAGLIIVKTW